MIDAWPQIGIRLCPAIEVRTPGKEPLWKTSHC
jgi:hypothetical protein